MSIFNIPSATLTSSTKQFVVPPTIQSDWHNYLMTDIPNVVYDFRLLHDWYDQYKTEEPI